MVFIAQIKIPSLQIERYSHPEVSIKEERVPVKFFLNV